MIVIFNKSDGSFYMAESSLSKNHDTDAFVSIEVKDFNGAHQYSLVDGEAVKGDVWSLTSKEQEDLAADVLATKHVTPRVLGYPDIGEQLGKLWHDIENNKVDKTGEFYKAIKAVKDANPKE